MRIARRLLLGLLAAFALAGVLAGLLFLGVEEVHERRKLEYIGALVAERAFESIEPAMRAHAGGTHALALPEPSASGPVRRIFIVNRAGAVRAASDPALRGRAFRRDERGCAECHAAPGLGSVVLPGTLRLARPLAAEGSCRDCHAGAARYLGCVVVDLGLPAYFSEVHGELGAALLFGAAFIALVGGATAALVRRWITERLERLDGAMQQLEAGDLTARAALSGSDEIARIGTGFNRMAAVIDQRDRERETLLEQVRAANQGLRGSEELARRAYEEQRVLNELLRLSLGAKPLDAVLRRALELLVGVPWLALQAKGAIFLLEGDALAMRASSGLDAGVLERCAQVALGACLCGQAAAQRRLICSRDVGPEHTVRYEGMQPHGHYCVPILSGEELVGVLTLYLQAGHAPDPEETTFLTAVANTLAGIVSRRRDQAERERLIAELKDVLDAVSQSHREWQSTFDGITDMISILTADAKILKVNRAYAEYFGAHPRDLVGRSCGEFCLGGHTMLGSCPLIASARDGAALTQELRDPRTGRIFRTSIFPYASAGGAADRFVHLSEDVSLEREREQRLMMSERLAALGQMASGIAHEINNPLASIAGCAESLLKRVERGAIEPALFREYLGIVNEEVFRCKRITTGMLSFVRRGSQERSLVHPQQSLDRALELIGFQGRLRAVSVTRDFAEQLPQVRASEGELRQVLLILLTNALDAMQDQGALRCSVRACGDAVRVSIEDSGPGIPPESLGRLFTPFHTTKAAQGGTGLGLSIAKRIVEDLGGSIGIESGPGGVTASITLPIR